MKVHLFGRQLEIKTELAVAAGVVLVLLGCLAGYLFSRDGRDIIIEADSGIPAGLSASISSGDPAAGNGTAAPVSTGMLSGNNLGNIAGTTTNTAISPTESIKVYVVGCVRQPGIVTLEKGAVIDDAVRKAGGLTPDADPNSINMVYRLTENVMLYIRSQKESGASEKQAAGTAEKGKAVKAASGKASDPGNGVRITDGSGNSAQLLAGGNAGSGGDASTGTGGSGGAGVDGSGTTGNGTVNINTAGIAGLDTLPGIGEATAREIIAFREKNGPFRRIEDIMKVPRIKQGRFDSIKDLISVN